MASGHDAPTETGLGGENEKSERRADSRAHAPPVRVRLRSRGFQRWRQSLARLRIQIVAETGELFFRGVARQNQVFRSRAERVAGYSLAFGVIVTDAQMLPEIFFGIPDTELRFGRNHILKYIALGSSGVSEQWARWPGFRRIVNGWRAD